jgi:hypothetical protein
MAQSSANLFITQQGDKVVRREEKREGRRKENCGEHRIIVFLPAWLRLAEDASRRMCS